MKRKIESILPKYAYFPLFMALFVNGIVYFGSKVITNQLVHYDITMGIDKIIPVIPGFVIIYLLCYVVWVIGYILIGREAKEFCFNYVMADIVAKFICLFFFIVIPSTNVRPILGNGVFDNILSFIYKMDEPVNLFPSIHCLESYMVFRSAIKMEKVSKLYKIFTFIFAILTFMSVVFIKQHVFIDIIGGILVVEVGLYIVKKTNLKRIFYWVDKYIS